MTTRTCTSLRVSPRRTLLYSTACLLLTSVVALGGCSGSFAAADASEAFASGATIASPDDRGETSNTEARATQLEYVRTDKDPFSTFAADVDSASYDLFVSSLTSNQLPPVESVRTEEFINSFDYDYPNPSEDSGHPFAISLAARRGLYDSQTALLRVGIRTKTPEAFEKKPANLVFLIDTSGSMQEANKLPLVQRVLTETLELLDEEDSVAIVTYAGSTRVALSATPVAEADRILAVIDDLTAGGSTAGASGLNLAYQEAEKHFMEQGINHVVLCTDGDFNVGPSSTEELVTIIEQKRQTGIIFTAVGFGDYPNDQMLESISNKGNGVYGIVATQEQARQYASERMLSSLQLVAKDVKIQVEFNPEQVYAYRLVGYENRQLADYQFYEDHVDAGEVGAGHRVTALYELALVESDLPAAAILTDGGDADAPKEIDASELVLVKVRYKDLDMGADDTSFELRESLALGGTLDGEEDLDWIAGVAAFGEVLSERRSLDTATLDMAEQLLERGAHDDPRRSEFITLVQQARGLLGKWVLNELRKTYRPQCLTS